MNLEPVEHETLRQQLRNSTVQFAFKKKDGTLRTAIGTTNLATIPVENHPTGAGQSSPSVVTFFDLEKQAWRCVSTKKEVFVAAVSL